ncbi:MAG TPA: T9SS type A sorting domain-containing protein [Ignavibacteriaceae bacterium]|nr:T9SS type A sorting domain-containing protein [Ignavibacteriaceae bacterium]
MSLRNKILILSSLTFLYNLFIYPQSENLIREISGITVNDLNQSLDNAFSGGHNNIEHQLIDIDGDNDLDLFFLDSDGYFGYYENKGDASSPSFVLADEILAGVEFKNWFYFVDIDDDSDYDLFTSGEADYIKLILNEGTSTMPDFILNKDTLLSADNSPIQSEFGSNPLFYDVDSDGDFDFISGNSAGTVTFYENIGTVNNYSFKFVTNLWQDLIIISTLTSFEKHGASSLEFADIDNDSDPDLFWGDFFSKSIYYIRNDGTAANPDMNVLYKIYPQNADSIKTNGFNMPRLADIDGDSDLDLFVSVLFDPTVPQGLMYYENQGTITTDDFHFVTKDLLKTLDVKTNSIPFFVDIDDDSDQDLFIGSLDNPVGKLFYFENTGTALQPEFTLRDSSFIDQDYSISLYPAFGDLDNDNDFDLLIGNFDGKISFYENIGNSKSPNFIFKELISNNLGSVIDIGTFARPLLFDVDSDDDLDLICGKFNGKFSYFRNIGTPLLFSFEEDTSYFSIIDVGDNSNPFLIDYDDDGDFDLFSGDHNGFINYFRNDGNNIDPIWISESNNFLQTDLGIDVSPFFIDIDNDSDIDLFAGNAKGGLFFYRNNMITNIEDGPLPDDYILKIEAFPNPFNPEINFILNGFSKQDKLNVSIFNILGEKIIELYNASPSKNSLNLKWNAGNFSSGIYLVRVSSSTQSEIKKIILSK